MILKMLQSAMGAYLGGKMRARQSRAKTDSRKSAGDTKSKSDSFSYPSSYSPRSSSMISNVSRTLQRQARAAQIQREEFEEELEEDLSPKAIQRQSKSPRDLPPMTIPVNRPKFAQLLNPVNNEANKPVDLAKGGAITFPLSLRMSLLHSANYSDEPTRYYIPPTILQIKSASRR